MNHRIARKIVKNSNTPPHADGKSRTTQYSRHQLDKAAARVAKHRGNRVVG